MRLVMDPLRECTIYEILHRDKAVKIVLIGPRGATFSAEALEEVTRQFGRIGEIAGPELRFVED